VQIREHTITEKTNVITLRDTTISQLEAEI